MKLLVCVSKTPDTTTKISFANNDTEFNTQGVQYIMNPYDEWYALVRALELKEAAGGTVTTINVGPAANDTVIRKGLAIGADDAIRVDAPADCSAFFVAKQIAEQAKAGAYDIVLFGKETIDYNGSQIGAMVAEMLDMPFISYATKMDIEGSTATISRDIEGGEEVVEVDAPFAISAAKGLAEQRIPNMRGIMMAKRKPLNVVPAVEVSEKVAVSSYELPPAKKDCHYIDAEDMDKLVELLHSEAKVI